jgi:hypothetical protein
MHSYVGDALGVFGPMGDLFGFDDLGDDPMSDANATDVEVAKRRVAQFRTLFPLIQGIQDVSVRQGAMDIVNTQWYKVGALSFLGLGGKYNLAQLADIVAGYAALPNQQFVYFNPDFTVNRIRENRLNDFVKGMRALESYMGRFIILPTQIKINDVDTSAASLLRLAQGKAQLARASGNPQDAAIAKIVAESARDAGAASGNSTVEYAASQIMAEMDQLASSKGTVIAPSGRNAGMDVSTMVIIGGGLAALVGIVYAMTRKP